MPGPLRNTLTIDGSKVDAFDVRFDVKTKSDIAGMPLHQSIVAQVDAYFNLNDPKLFPHADLKKLFDLANVPTHEKIKEMKVEVWTDDSKEDCIYSLKFKGWISHYEILSPFTSQFLEERLNAVLHLTLIPVVNREMYQDIMFGN